jgi:hypothetical protein
MDLEQEAEIFEICAIMQTNATNLKDGKLKRDETSRLLGEIFAHTDWDNPHYHERRDSCSKVNVCMGTKLRPFFYNFMVRKGEIALKEAADKFYRHVTGEKVSLTDEDVGVLAEFSQYVSDRLLCHLNRKHGHV